MDLATLMRRPTRYWKLLKRINPKIQNFDMIYPGQIIMFPGTSPGDTLLPTGSGDVSAPIPEYKDVTIPRHKMLPVIHHIINMMYGEIISDGNYCIPVPPSSEVKIDCSRVPVVEIENGNIILLDLSNRIPEDLKKVIEATWENYYVISAQKGEEISHMLERIISSSGVYEIEKVNRYEEIGNIPAVLKTIIAINQTKCFLPADFHRPIPFQIIVQTPKSINSTINIGFVVIGSIIFLPFPLLFIISKFFVS